MKRTLWLIPLVLIIGATMLMAVPTRNAANRPAFQDAPNVFTGDTHDFYFNGVMADPIAPLASQGAMTGGSCTSTTTYRLYSSYTNATGHTDLSPPSIEFKPASGSTNKITVTVQATDIPDNANTWAAWFTSSSDSHQIVYGCGASGAETSTSSSTLTYSCLCSESDVVSEPKSNTTAAVHVMRVSISPSSNIVDFDGTGSTYFSRDRAASMFDLYAFGSIGATFGANFFGPPACPTDLGVMAPGICLQSGTGKLVFRDSDGAFYRDGSVAQ